MSFNPEMPYPMIKPSIRLDIALVSSAPLAAAEKQKQLAKITKHFFKELTGAQTIIELGSGSAN